MCYHPKHILIENKRPSAAYPNSYIELDVPCGTCVSCLKRRQNDFAARLSREVQSACSMFFVTLTYNNQNIPLMRNFYRVDSDTGELFRNGDSEILDSGDVCDSLRAEFSRVKSSRSARYLNKYILDSDGSALCIDGFYYLCRYTPSLYREHVKNWLKGCRVQYKRDTGKSLNFRYAWCGEYGFNRSRPHYHLCILNLSKEVISWMLLRWNKGYTYLQEVPAINPDGSNARAIAARYIAKYVSKGKFDVDSVLNSDSQKGRLCNSKRFGTFDFTPEEISYYRAYDIHGAYDINSFGRLSKDGVWDGTYLSDKQINEVVAEVFNRQHYSIMVGHEVRRFSLPRAFRVRLFYLRDSVKRINIRLQSRLLPCFIDGYRKCLKFSDDTFIKQRKTCCVYRASLLSRKVSDYSLMLFASEYSDEYKQFCSDKHFSEGSFDSFASFKTYYQSTQSCLFESMEENFYETSLVSTSKDGQ